MKKFFDCPICGEKNKAYISQTYPDAIVHKCNGGILKEVAKFSNGQMVSNQPTQQKKKDYINKLVTNNFYLHKITEASVLIDCGRKLNNIAMQLGYAKTFLSEGDVFIATRESHLVNPLYMIVIKNKTITGSSMFSGHHMLPIPKKDGIEIIHKLIQESLLDKNPFPQSY